MAVNNLNTGVGIQPTIVDAKGDLIAATANDAVNRLAVGTNGQVLVADSGETTGLKWNNPGTVGGLVHIETQTLSAVSAISVNDVFTSTYQNYKIFIEVTKSAAALDSFRLRAAGIDNTASVYQSRYTTGSGAVSETNSNIWAMTTSVGTNNVNAVELTLYKPNQNTTTIGHSTYAHSVESTNIGWLGRAYGHGAAYQADGFTYSIGSGTISGTIRIYGLKD